MLIQFRINPENLIDPFNQFLDELKPERFANVTDETFHIGIQIVGGFISIAQANRLMGVIASNHFIVFGSFAVEHAKNFFEEEWRKCVLKAIHNCFEAHRLLGFTKEKESCRFVPPDLQFPD